MKSYPTPQLVRPPVDLTTASPIRFWTARAPVRGVECSWAFDSVKRTFHVSFLIMYLLVVNEAMAVSMNVVRYSMRNARSSTPSSPTRCTPILLHHCSQIFQCQTQAPLLQCCWRGCCMFGNNAINLKPLLFCGNVYAKSPTNPLTGLHPALLTIPQKRRTIRQEMGQYIWAFSFSFD